MIYCKIHLNIGRTLLNFKGDMEYFTSDNIVAANDSSQSSNEAFIVKM